MKTKITTLITLLASGTFACAASSAGAQGSTSSNLGTQSGSESQQSAISENRSSGEDRQLTRDGQSSKDKEHRIISQIQAADYDARDQVADRVEKYLKKDKKDHKKHGKDTKHKKDSELTDTRSDEASDSYARTSRDSSGEKQELREQVREDLETLRNSDSDEFLEAKNELTQSIAEFMTASSDSSAQSSRSFEGESSTTQARSSGF